MGLFTPTAAPLVGGAVSEPLVARVGGHRDWRSRLQRVALWLLLINALLLAFVGGVKLRTWLWERTKSARFTYDINNGHHWGSRIFDGAQALAAADNHPGHGADWRYFLPAYAGLYDQVVAESPNDKYLLDYSPARLMVMALWVRHERTVYPQTRSWVPPYAYTAPLLRFNTLCELLAAIAGGLLVRHWMLRDTRARLASRIRGSRWDPSVAWLLPPALPARPYPSTASLCGVIAALLIWFNPADLPDAHVWPQWDVWLLPFFLIAILAASLDWWFTAGAIVAFGAMFKGQLVMVAPILLLWPLFAGWWNALFRIACGVAFSLAAITCVWLVNGRGGWIWVGGITLGFLVAYALIRLRGEPDRRRRMLRALPFWTAGIFALAVFSALPLFHGSLAWQKVGYGYPTYHFPWMVVGEAANLAAILAAPPFLFQLNDPALHVRFGPMGIDTAISIKTVLVCLYGIALVLCGIGAARLSRRNDRRFLLVPGTVCLLMFSLLPQMHERYLLWAAAVTALAVGVSFGMTLLHLFISALACEMIIPYVLNRDPSLLPGLRHFIAGVFPGDAWAVLLCAAIFLYQILKTPRSDRSNVSEARNMGIAMAER